MDTSKTFSILDHIEKLEPAKGKGRYVCPACQGNNFTIGKKGAYQCWSGCKSLDIREALAPRGSRHQSRRSNRVIPRQPSPPAPAPLPALDQLVLARLPEPPSDIPVKQHRLDRERGKIAEIIYRYGASREVYRSEWADSEKPKGYAKSVIPYHVDSSGQVLKGKGDEQWPLYKEDEALIHGVGKWIVLPEGEPCVEVCRWLQLIGITFQGSDWSQEVIEKKLVEFKTAGIAGILCLPDNDEPGTLKASKVALAADIVGIPMLTILPKALWSDIPHAGDIADWVKWGQEQGMERSDFIRKLEEQFHASAASRNEVGNLSDADVDIPDFANRARDVKEIFCQTAFESLYSYWPWICLKNVLYCWSKCQTHYFESPDVVERRRIAEFCNTYPVEHTTKSGEVYYKYDYATPEWVERVLKWVKIRLAIKPELANPPGLNCTNGVLQLSWSGDKPSWALVDHDPKMYYTYEPLVEYNPDAPKTNCERLLEVLDKPQQEVFLRTIAASLDMATVRKYKGRLVRALLLKGSGNNGKDTLREAVAAMYGYRGMTGSTLTDFAAYDQGRKFPLSRLSNSRVNWASENANFAFLDKIQSLKAFVTGDPLDIEHKGKDHYEFIPVGVGLFNVNDTPNLQGSLEAILSRYGVLTFIKTFKIGADPSKGEIEADSRFKYDPDFLRSEVLPAFLNRVLAALTQLMAEGIDYRCTEKAFADIQAENSHLFQFCQATRLGYNPNGKVYAGEIWLQLEQWYVDQGALTYEESANGKKKAIWSPFSDKRSDELVKSANQVVKRFSSLFPKAKRGNDKHKVYLTGLSFNTAPTPGGEPIEPLGEPMVSQLVSLQPLPNKDGEPSEPIYPYPGNEENFLGIFESETFESNLKCWEEDVSENLAHLPHHPAIASDTGSPIDSLIGSPDAQIGSPPFHHEELAQPGQSPALGDSDKQRLSESATALNPASPKEADASAPSAASTPNPQNLVIHDFVIDASGRMAEITKFARGGWLTSSDQHISRDDLKAGVYTKLDPSRADLPPSVLDAMLLIGFANGINDLEMVRDLTQDWSGEYKKEVWGYLSPKLQAKYLALAGCSHMNYPQ